VARGSQIQGQLGLHSENMSQKPEMKRNKKEKKKLEMLIVVLTLWISYPIMMLGSPLHL
jgi:hypothetical protein